VGVALWVSLSSLKSPSIAAEATYASKASANL
jgi:hypothetical protein